MGLFRRKHTAAEEEIVSEKWSTSFSLFQDHRFIPEQQDDYCSRIHNGHLDLELNRNNLFAWTDNPLYRYENFMLSAAVKIDSGNSYSAAGFLFRKIDDSTYYYFIISNRGYFRLDSVLNGSPSPLIDWTECPGFSPEKFTAGILAEGSSINLFLDGRWIGAVSDEAIPAGGIAFAAQNYNESQQAVFRLKRIEIESRPAELDKISGKLLSKPVPAEVKVRLAEGQLRLGRYTAALVELKRALSDEPDNAGILMMTANCCISLEMYPEAREYLERVPAGERDEAYYICYAGMLYLMNSFIELRDLLKKRSDVLKNNPVAHNLEGNAEFSLGNWNGAAEAYDNARNLESENPVFALNFARAAEKAGDRQKALAAYNTAATLFFRREEYEELRGILSFIERLDPESPETEVIRAKILFHEEDFEAADEILSSQIKRKTEDSTVFYLKALLAIRDGKPKKAEPLLKKAVSYEPGYYLYHFKLAEIRYLTGKKYEQEIERALELAPDDPWTLNLAGLSALDKKKPEEAALYFKSASEILPDESEITVNYSEALFVSGEKDDAVAVLHEEKPEILNQRGNIYSRCAEYAPAVESYEAAYAFDHDSVNIMLNLSAALIETDSFSRAEELLARILDREDNPEAYNLMGNLALLKGEYSRAEAAFRHAVDFRPDFYEAVCNLAELYLSRERLNEADMIIGKIDASAAGQRAETLKKEIFRRRMRIYNCESCGHEWTVPKKMGSQPALKLVGEPPDDMPAGKCGNCGKLYCVGCAKKNLKDGRFVCESCGGPLKLSEDWMRYLFNENMLDK